MVIEDKRDQLGINLLNTNLDIIYWNISETKFQAEPLDTNVFLIKDESVNPFENQKIAISKDNDYLMHHSTCNHINTGFKNVHSDGMHEPNNPHYTEVFDIIFSQITPMDKAAKIIEFLFPSADAILGKKLDLLHNLLVPPVDFTEAQKQWEEIKKSVKTANDSGVKVTLSSDENALKDFTNDATGITDAFDPKYLESLRKLRNKLLVS